MTIDEAIAEIKRLGTQAKATPYFVHPGFSDRNSKWVTDDFIAFGDSADDRQNYDLLELGDPEDMAYLVACANAAPSLCEEIRRLRADLEYVNERYKGACISLSESLEKIEELEDEA